FFQAEDGIRDFHVTGVQTCALPICPSRRCGPSQSAGAVRVVGIRKGRRTPALRRLAVVRGHGQRPSDIVAVRTVAGDPSFSRTLMRASYQRNYGIQDLSARSWLSRAGGSALDDAGLRDLDRLAGAARLAAEA